MLDDNPFMVGKLQGARMAFFDYCSVMKHAVERDAKLDDSLQHIECRIPPGDDILDKGKGLCESIQSQRNLRFLEGISCGYASVDKANDIATL